eukprot:1844715-Amphidinium_carterae.11
MPYLANNDETTQLRLTSFSKSCDAVSAHYPLVPIFVLKGKRSSLRKVWQTASPYAAHPSCSAQRVCQGLFCFVLNLRLV